MPRRRCVGHSRHTHAGHARRPASPGGHPRLRGAAGPQPPAAPQSWLICLTPCPGRIPTGRSSTCGRKKNLNMNYFASSDPHHGIQFIPSGILSGKSSGILFGILFQILSGISSGILSVISSDILSGISIWQIYLAYLLTFYLAFYLSYLLTFYLAYLSVISSDILSGISIWHSIWHVF